MTNGRVRGHVPGRPLTDTSVLEPLGTKVFGDNRFLLVAPPFLNVGIVVIWFGHHSVSLSEASLYRFRIPRVIRVTRRGRMQPVVQSVLDRRLLTAFHLSQS